MIEIFQNTAFLSGVGMGVKNDADLPTGAHLRWQFPGWLGFPQQGFKVYRRLHGPKKLDYYRCSQQIQLSNWYRSQQLAQTPATPKPLLTNGPSIFKPTGELYLQSVVTPSGRSTEGISLDAAKLVISLPVSVVPYEIGFTFLRKAISGNFLVEAFRAGEKRTSRWMNQPMASEDGWMAAPVTLYYPDEGIDRIEITGSLAILTEIRFHLEPCGWEDPVARLPIPVTHQLSPEKIESWLVESIGSHPQTYLPAEYLMPDSSLAYYYRSRANDLQQELETVYQMETDPQLPLDSYAGSEIDEAPAGEFPKIEALFLAGTNYNFARATSLAWQDPVSTGHFDYKVEGNWQLKIGGQVHQLRVSWVIYGVSIKERGALAAPTGLSATTFRAPILLANSSAEPSMTAYAGLAWTIPDRTPGKPEAPIAYLIEKETPGGRIEGRWEVVNQDTYRNIFLPDLLFVDDDLAADPGERGFFREALTFGTHRYRIRGVDLFGRVSLPSAAVLVRVEDDEMPPVPENVQVACIEEGEPVLQIDWEFDLDRAAHLTPVFRFEVFARNGLLNTEQGTLRNIAPVAQGEETLRLDTDLDLSAYSQNALANGRSVFIAQGQTYPVTAHASGTNGRITLKVPVVRTPDGRTEKRLDLPVAGTLRIGSQYYRYQDSADPEAWLQSGGLKVGFLNNNSGYPFEQLGTGLILEHSPGFPKNENGRLQCRVWVRGWNWQAAVPGFGKSYVQAGVRAVRRNLQGSLISSGVGGPGQGFRLELTPPPAPGFGETGVVYAPLPDQRGISRMEVNWTAEYPFRYEVYRASAVELLRIAAGMKEGRGLPVAVDENLGLRALAAHKAVQHAFRKVGTIAAQISGVPLSFRDELPGQTQAQFVYHVMAVSPAGVTSAWPELSAAEWQVLETGVPTSGITLNDLTLKLENSFLVVETQDFRRPAQPRIDKIEGGEQKVVLSWERIPELEPGVSGFRIYKTTRKDLAGDWLNMVPVGGLLRNSTRARTYHLEVRHESTGERWVLEDHEVTPFAHHWYQLFAVKESPTGEELISAPLPVALTARPVKRTLPVVPDWYRITQYSSQFAVRWIRPSEFVEVKILYRIVENQYHPWEVISGSRYNSEGWMRPDRDFSYRYRTYVNGRRIVYTFMRAGTWQYGKRYQFKMISRDIYGNISEGEILEVRT